jgi:hypothetical protein
MSVSTSTVRPAGITTEALASGRRPPHSDGSDQWVAVPLGIAGAGGGSAPLGGGEAGGEAGGDAGGEAGGGGVDGGGVVAGGTEGGGALTGGGALAAGGAAVGASAPPPEQPASRPSVISRPHSAVATPRAARAPPVGGVDGRVEAIESGAVTVGVLQARKTTGLSERRRAAAGVS